LHSFLGPTRVFTGRDQNPFTGGLNILAQKFAHFRFLDTKGPGLLKKTLFYSLGVISTEKGLLDLNPLVFDLLFRGQRSLFEKTQREWGALLRVWDILPFQGFWVSGIILTSLDLKGTPIPHTSSFPRTRDLETVCKGRFLLKGFPL